MRQWVWPSGKHGWNLKNPLWLQSSHLKRVNFIFCKYQWRQLWSPDVLMNTNLQSINDLILMLHDTVTPYYIKVCLLRFSSPKNWSKTEPKRRVSKGHGRLEESTCIQQVPRKIHTAHHWLVVWLVVWVMPHENLIKNSVSSYPCISTSFTLNGESW